MDTWIPSPVERFAPSAFRFRAWLGHGFELDGLRVYHAGDTDLIPELAVVKADLAVLPVGGLVTLNAGESVEAGRRFAAGWSGTAVLPERP